MRIHSRVGLALALCLLHVRVHYAKLARDHKCSERVSGTRKVQTVQGDRELQTGSPHTQTHCVSTFNYAIKNALHPADRCARSLFN